MAIISRLPMGSQEPLPEQTIIVGSYSGSGDYSPLVDAGMARSYDKNKYKQICICGKVVITSSGSDVYFYLIVNHSDILANNIVYKTITMYSSGTNVGNLIVRYNPSSTGTELFSTGDIELSYDYIAYPDNGFSVEMYVTVLGTFQGFNGSL